MFVKIDTTAHNTATVTLNVIHWMSLCPRFGGPDDEIARLFDNIFEMYWKRAPEDSKIMKQCRKFVKDEYGLNLNRKDISIAI